jgi:hypothetical protein
VTADFFSHEAREQQDESLAKGMPFPCNILLGMQPASSTLDSEEHTRVCSADAANGNNKDNISLLENDGPDTLPAVDMDFVGYELPGQDQTLMRFRRVSYLPTFL